MCITEHDSFIVVNHPDSGVAVSACLCVQVHQCSGGCADSPWQQQRVTQQRLVTLLAATARLLACA
jgi:hypothetical protein